ncbi:FtsK/SpoIIIE domain-containing protein, partial [Kineococcus glutinatus]|uniref:FtsK/SpoIIIE domain-containing protein n=1 Tax=Kineococcus glutinatus TaxID=1070872 RepID=UPI0031EB3198
PRLPPLPAHVAAADLVTGAAGAGDGGPGATTGLRLPWGLLDLPDEQRRAPACWDLAEGEHLAVVGTVRSGRSTLVRTLVRAAGDASTPVHCYVLDGGGALAELAALPHVGAVVGPHETWRAARVLARLLEEVAERRRLLAAAGARTLEELDASGGGSRPPHLLVALDGWDTWTRVLAEADPAVGVEPLLRLLREASAVGVRVLLCGDRSLLTSAAAASAGALVLLRLA